MAVYPSRRTQPYRAAELHPAADGKCQAVYIVRSGREKSSKVGAYRDGQEHECDQLAANPEGTLCTDHAAEASEGYARMYYAEKEGKVRPTPRVRVDKGAETAQTQQCAHQRQPLRYSEELMVLLTHHQFCLNWTTHQIAEHAAKFQWSDSHGEPLLEPSITASTRRMLEGSIWVNSDVGVVLRFLTRRHPRTKWAVRCDFNMPDLHRKHQKEMREWCAGRGLYKYPRGARRDLNNKRQPHESQRLDPETVVSYRQDTNTTANQPAEYADAVERGLVWLQTEYNHVVLEPLSEGEIAANLINLQQLTEQDYHGAGQ